VWDVVNILLVVDGMFDPIVDQRFQEQDRSGILQIDPVTGHEITNMDDDLVLDLIDLQVSMEP
jgi:hypothetical protein